MRFWLTRNQNDKMDVKYGRMQRGNEITRSGWLDKDGSSH